MGACEKVKSTVQLSCRWNNTSLLPHPIDNNTRSDPNKVSNQSTLLSPTVTESLLLKNDSTTSNGHNQQANNDVSITTVQSFSQQHDAPLEQPLQQSSISSKVTTDNPITVSISSTLPETGQLELCKYTH